MSTFAVIREAGPGWRDGGIYDQPAVDEHAAFMNALTEEGFVVLGGPLGDGARVMLIINVEREQEIERRLADDPWIQMGLLSVVSVEPWEILLGD